MLLNVSDSTSLFIFFLSDVVYSLNSYSYDEPVHHIMHEHEHEYGNEREVLKRLKLFFMCVDFIFLHTGTMK